MTSPRIQLHTQQLNIIATQSKNYHKRADYTYHGTQGSDQALALLKQYKINPPSRPWGMIFNIDPISKPGQHWVALYATEHSKTRIEIMDSFGSDQMKQSYVHHPILSEILNYVDVVRMPRLQSHHTYVCGHYCLAYLYARTKGRSFSHFVKSFNKKKPSWE